MADAFSTISSVILSVLVLYIGKRVLERKVDVSRGVLPPGPPGYWLFGTEIPLESPYRVFEEWTKRYGPVISFRQGPFKTVVIIGRYEPALEIMEKEGASLADRPLSISAGKTLSGGMRILLVPSSARLKRLRKALHTNLQSKIARTYEPIQQANSKNVVLDILAEPARHQEHAKRYAASVIMTLTYGKTTPTSYSDPEVQKVNLCLERLGRVVRPGAYLVDSFPFLQYVPGYLSQLRKYHQDELSLFRSQMEAVRLKMVAGEDVEPCFAKYLLENQTQFELSNDEAAYLAGSMFGAGSDTTAAAISIVIMAAACHPKAQAKVHEELDSVVGRDRYPTFDDENMLTQTMAYVLESYRWRPVSAGGFAHRATKDVIWRNYLIPAGATVIGNHWSIFRDPNVFPDPETFDPQRWIGSDGKIREDLKSFNFGFGRRVCPGNQVANRSVFINTAMILWAFRISQDPSSPVDTMAFTNTANVHPLPFKVVFEPRMDSEKLRRIIQESSE